MSASIPWAALAAVAALCLVQGVALVLLWRRLRATRRLLAGLGGEMERKLGQRKTVRLVRQAGERAAGHFTTEHTTAGRKPARRAS